MNTVTLKPSWTKNFAGRWQDDRSAEEIIEDIRASRNANIKGLVL